MTATQRATGRLYEQDDVFRSKHIVDGVLSPDGAFAVYALSEVFPGKTRDEDTQITSLWQVDLAGGEQKRLTPKDKNSSLPQIAPDGHSLFFLSARDAEGKVGQVYRLPLGGGEAEQITSFEQGIASFVLSPDGASIAASVPEKLPKPAGSNDHVRIARFAYRTDIVPGYLQDAMQAIYLISVNDGETKALTGYDGIVGALAWSPDGHEIAAFTMCRASQNAFAMRGDIMVLDREGTKRKLIDGITTTNLFWTRDGKYVGYAASPSGRLASQAQLFLLDRTSGERMSRTGKLDLPVASGSVTHSPGAFARPRIQLTSDGKYAITQITQGGETGIYRIALSGEESYEPLVTGARSCKVFDQAGSLVLFSSEDSLAPSELYAFDLTTKHERAITHNNAEWHAQIMWPRLEHLAVTSAPGVEIEGWVLLPLEGTGPFKTILNIHGGPHAGYGYSFNEDFHELIGAGYALAFANPRGSTGYGDAFAESIIGRWGHPEFEDFTAFLDELVHRGISDPDKLGVMGVSGGGHLSAWLIGHTDRFKAAIPEEGVYNIISFYGVSDVGIELATLEMGCAPQENIQRYWDLSPIAHAHKVKTPTLLIQGETDIRCPMEQAEQLFTILKYNGCEVELLRLQNCNHGKEVSGPPPLRRYRMDAIVDWFNRHI